MPKKQQNTKAVKKPKKPKMQQNRLIKGIISIFNGNQNNNKPSIVIPYSDEPKLTSYEQFYIVLNNTYADLTYYTNTVVRGTKSWVVDPISNLMTRGWGYLTTTDPIGRAHKTQMREDQQFRQEFTKIQELRKRERQAKASRLFNDDVAQLDRELETCKNWYEHNKWERTKLFKQHTGQPVYDENGNPKLNIEVLLAEHSYLDHDRIQDVCTKMETTRHKIFKNYYRDYDQKEPKYQEITSGDDCQIKLDTMMTSYDRCESEYSILTQKDEDCNDRMISCQKRLDYTTKQVLNCVPMNTNDHNELRDRCTYYIQNNMTNADKQNLANTIKAVSQNQTILKEVLRRILYFLIWPTYCLDANWGGYQYLDMKPNIAQRIIITVFSIAFWYQLLFFSLNNLPFGHFKSFLKSREESKKESKEEQKEKANNQKLNKRAQKLSNKREADRLKSLKLQGGYQVKSIDPVCFDPVFLIIHQFRIKKYLQGDITLETLMNFATIEEKEIRSFKKFWNPIRDQANEISNGTQEKSSYKIFKLFAKLLTSEYAVMFGVGAIMAIVTALSIENTHFGDSSDDMRSTIGDPIETIQPNFEGQLAKIKPQNSDKIIPIAEKELKLSPEKIKISSSRKKVPLSKRTQTLEGLSKNSNQETQNDYLNLNEKQTQKREPIKIRISNHELIIE